jgi:hypothetical protein
VQPCYLVQVELNLLPELQACTSMSAPAATADHTEQIVWYLAVRNPYGKRLLLVKLMVSLLFLERSNVCLQANKNSMSQLSNWHARATQCLMPGAHLLDGANAWPTLPGLASR